MGINSSGLVISHVKKTYVQIERYRADYEGDSAWMNFTFIGEPEVTVSLGMNEIRTSEKIYAMPTLTRLENSLLLVIDNSGDMLTLQYAPVSSNQFGNIISVPHESSGKMRVSASTEKGMEQVIRHIGNTLSTQDIKKKSVHELERRIRTLEKKLQNFIIESEKKYSENIRISNDHKHNVGKLYSDLNTLQGDTVSEVESLRGSIAKWAFFILIITMIVLFVSWREYQRHKKSSRWRL